MTSSNDLMQKMLTTTSFANGGGLLKPEQANRFIDYMWDATVLLPQVRTRRMTRDIEDIDKINVGRRILRGASEGVDDGMNVTVRFGKISLTSSKFRADWEMSRDLLEDNLEGAALEEHIARLLTTQIGQDLEDLAINGDKSSSDPLLHHLDGWSIRGRVDGHVVEAADEQSVAQVMDTMIRRMPRAFLNRRQNLRFFAGPNLVQRYVDEVGLAVANQSIVDVRTQLGDDNVLSGPAGYSVSGRGGIRMQEVPLLGAIAPDQAPEAGDDGEIWLTDPNNLVFGIRRELEVFNQFNQKKDAIEYTVYTRVAAAIEETRAVVVATGVSEDVLEPASAVND